MYSDPRYVSTQRLIFTRARRARLEAKCYAVALTVFAAAAVIVVNFGYLLD